MDKKIRVLFITDRAAGGTGPNRRVVGCLNAITLLKEVELTLVAKEIDFNEPFAKRLSRYQLGYDPLSKISFFKNLFIIWQNARHADIIYVSNGLHNFLYAWLFRRKKRKLVAGPSITAIPILCPPTDPSRLMTVSMVDTWIEQSEIRAQYAMSGGAKRHEFVVLHNCLDMSKFSPERRVDGFWKRFGIDNSNVKILFSARIIFRPNAVHKNRKGAEVLLDAFEIAMKTHENIDLIFIGTASDEKKKLYADRKNVHFVGPLKDDELPVAYASADIGVFPSVYEGSGWVGKEMFASGLPLISSKAGIMPEMIDSGVSGILFDLFDKMGQEPSPDAPQRLAKEINRLLDDNDFRLKLGKNARIQAMEKLSEQVFADQLLLVFRAVLKGVRNPWLNAQE